MCISYKSRAVLLSLLLLHLDWNCSFIKRNKAKELFLYLKPLVVEIYFEGLNVLMKLRKYFNVKNRQGWLYNIDSLLNHPVNWTTSFPTELFLCIKCIFCLLRVWFLICKPCPFGLRKWLNPVVVIFFKNAKKNDKCWLIQSL